MSAIIDAMGRRPTGQRRGRPSKGPRIVVVPRLLHHDHAIFTELANDRGLYMSELAAELIAEGLRRTDRLPHDLPQRLTSGEAADFTARIPEHDGVAVRSIARARDRSISIVTGALITIGLRRATVTSGHRTSALPTNKAATLTRAS